MINIKRCIIDVLEADECYDAIHAMSLDRLQDLCASEIMGDDEEIDVEEILGEVLNELECDNDISAAMQGSVVRYWLNSN